VFQRAGQGWKRRAESGGSDGCHRGKDGIRREHGTLPRTNVRPEPGRQPRQGRVCPAVDGHVWTLGGHSAR